MNQKKIAYNTVKNTVLRLYGKWFTKPYDLNIFGIRNTNRVPDSFDDFIGICWTDFNGKNNILLAKATTDPGLYYLKNPINVNGTGILAKGYYQGLWKRGLHKGKPAFIQVGPCNIIRDRNKDGILDFDSNFIEKNVFVGCDLHRANDGRETTVVGKWSAACQVPSHSKYVDEFLKLAVMQETYIKCKTFSYALFGIEDI